MKNMLAFAAGAAACFFALACGYKQPAASAAENGLRGDLAAVGELVSFKEVEAAEKALPEGKGLVLRFEGEVRWHTLEEASRLQGGNGDMQAYLGKAEYLAKALGSGPKAGRTEAVKGAMLLMKTDVGWVYKGLSGS